MSRGGVVFRVNIGGNDNADPRWLLPLICRRGGVTRREVGAIRIAPRKRRCSRSPATRPPSSRPRPRSSIPAPATSSSSAPTPSSAPRRPRARWRRTSPKAARKRRGRSAERRGPRDRPPAPIHARPAHPPSAAHKPQPQPAETHKPLPAEAHKAQPAEAHSGRPRRGSPRARAAGTRPTGAMHPQASPRQPQVRPERPLPGCVEPRPEYAKSVFFTFSVESPSAGGRPAYGGPPTRSRGTVGDGPSRSR